MSKARAAIVSASGSGRKRTIPALRESEVCEVSLIHGRDQHVLSQIAGEYEIGATATTLEQLIKKRSFDFAIICSPPFMHADQARTLLDAGIPCLIEKPAATTPADARTIAEASEASGALVAVAHQLRHQNTYKAIKHALISGQIGTLISAQLEWSFKLNTAAPSAKWKLDPNLNGQSSLYDAGVHCVDAAIGWFGAGTVSAATGIKAKTGTYEHVDLTSLHESVCVNIRSSRLYGPYRNDLLINGTTGYISAAGFFTEHSADEVQIVTEGKKSATKTDGNNPYRLEIEDFARAVLNGSSTSGTTINEAISALEMLEASDELLSAKSIEG